jgi:hypothetical protein
MKSLNRSYNLQVFGTYIIYLPNVEKSVEFAERCLESCQRIGQKAELFEGFDGTGKEIIVPDHFKNQSWVKWLKVTDHFQSLTEVALSLSHIALWVKCMEVDQPIVILEHDAIMVKPYDIHPFYNIISYLGCQEQLALNSLPAIPMHRTINNNWHYINKTHAYCIDPPSARKLFLNVLDRGIFESADVMIKCDDVGIVQQGLFAYEDDRGYTTIPARKVDKDHRLAK